MYMRLAFSVAINVDADILLIDEILAVGDANFQSKCFNKLREIKAQGTTIVIVSHSLGQIEQICDRSIWIHEGLIRAEGPPKEIDLEYLDYMSRKRQELMKAAEAGTEKEETTEEENYTEDEENTEEENYDEDYDEE
jgi:ABC-2 type transport system ATP-binding protein